MRYGLAAIFSTIKDIKKGDELFCNYGYDVNTKIHGLEWYVNEWKEFKANPANAERVEQLKKDYDERMKD